MVLDVLLLSTFILLTPFIIQFYQKDHKMQHRTTLIIRFFMLKEIDFFANIFLSGGNL